MNNNTVTVGLETALINIGLHQKQLATSIAIH